MGFKVDKKKNLGICNHINGLKEERTGWKEED
jgi:hypothetical protein